MPQFSPSSMAAVARALPALRLQPPQPFLLALLERALPLADAFSCAELADLLAGLAELRYLPPDSWREPMVEQVRRGGGGGGCRGCGRVGGGGGCML
jgi:hypothetical protein